MTTNHVATPSFRFSRWFIVLAACLVALALAVPGAPATNAAGPLQNAGWGDASLIDYDPFEYQGSMVRVAQRIGATHAWGKGLTGQGVDVALIDSGVVPVEGLTVPGKVINGPDLSFESQADNLRYLDTYGHGTHMAGIIAGRDSLAHMINVNSASDLFVGMAPGARIVNVKVADSRGAADVSQVIAAIDWVVQHRHDNGMNIRVLNLSYGTDGTQDYLVDPLAFAVEQAWKAGIVVVVAAGNDGAGSMLRNPAIDPFVIAVGASTGAKIKGKSNPVADFSSCGDENRHVDLIAPGNSIVSLRNPGSYADVHYPQAVVVDRLFLGSGTSQAAAATSGAVALLLEDRPGLTPDQVKAILMETAETTRHLDPICGGAGEVNLFKAFDYDPPSVVQPFAPSLGTGSLEEARGNNHVYDEGVPLAGEQDIFGQVWDGASWSQLAAAGASWSGGDWNGSTWTGASWSGASWSGASWSSASWSGASWSGASWSSKSWSSASWSGASWSGASWSSASWSGASWSGDVWHGLSWRGLSWR
jgi:serine protease AprX